MWQADGSGWRARIGVLTPHVDFVPESEIQQMAPDGVSIHSARAILGVIDEAGNIAPKIGPEAVRGFAQPPHIDEATRLLTAVNPQAIIYAFTSSSYLLGADEDFAMKHRLEQYGQAEFELIIPTLSVLFALQKLGVSKLALIHPPWFPDELDQLGADYFIAKSIEVVHHGQAQVRQDFGEIYPGQLYSWVRQRVPKSAEAVFIGGNGMRAIGCIRALEEDLGVPILTANQVALWHALRVADVKAVVQNYGRIFELI